MGNSGEAAEKYISSGGRTLLFALLFASCLAVAAAQAEDLIVDGTTVVLDGAHTYASVQIRNGGTLTHSAATPGSEYSLDLTVTGTLVIDVTSTIDVSARGYVGGRTIGNVTTGAASGRSGGSCGGRGFPWEGNPNQTYGDFRDPRYPGSGAAIDKVTGGIGGGVVRIHAATLLLDGSIRADGGNGPGGGGGGSGGSVYIVVDSLQGSGSISANGGKGNIECYYGCRVGGGGGGGRVALYYSANNGFDLTRVTAAGGDNGTGDAGPGAAGTVYLKQSGHAGDLRIVSAAADVGAWTPLLADDALESESVTIAGPGVMVVSDQDRPIIATNVVLQGGAVLSHLPATSTESHALRLVVRSNLAIDAASKIDVSKRGYIVGRTLDNTTAGAAGALGGGSYGGLGGGTSNYTYGDPTYPNEIGSGGGPADGIGSGAGGGLVHVSARHASIDGAILSDGADGNKPAGSGGGIVLNAGTLTGAGTISAAGGKGGTYCYYGCNYGGGGGGGRVAVYVWGANTFDPAHITATKGGGDVPGEDGTVVFPPQPFFAWAEPGSDLFHGTVQLVWEALATDPDTITAEITAVGSHQAYPLGTAVAALGTMRWNTAAVPDGVYELRAVFHNQASQVIGTATRQIVVNNSVAWHAGRITANETWAANVVHVVEGNLAVTSGATLSIAPGAVIKFAPRTGMTIEAGATLSAPAAAIFTALADDTAGGDTNLDGAQSLPRRGDWDGSLVDATGQLNLSDAVERRFMRMLHRGTLTASETWAAAFVHEIAADVVVPNGLTLTLEPGALVTFDRKLGITLETGSRLIAAGSVAQPITFTSIRDESFGGTAGGDASRGMPEAGDWRWIYVDGADATFDHVEMRYGAGTSSGSWDQTGMIRTTGAASLTVTNSILRDAFFDGILAWGGMATIRSSVFTNIDRAICAHPGSSVHVVNCTVDGNRIGLLVHGGTMDATNTIVSNNHDSGIEYDFGTLTSVRYSDVWAPSGSTSANYSGTSDPTGSNGNISRDPHYVDREHRDYRLDYRSPAIDAADGSVAPTTDIIGSPRYDDPRTSNTGIATGGGAYADMGAYEFVETASSNLDLVVSSVSGPAAVVAGDTVRVQWTITNIGSGEVVGPWHDTVNLVLSPDANPTVIFAAEVLVGEGARLGPGQSLSTLAEIRVPGSVVGTHYWQVVTNTRGEVFEGRNRDNNTGLSLAPVAVDLPELVVGGPALSRQFSVVGEAHWFKFVPEAGQDVLVRLDRAGTGGATELYIGQGYMPSRERFDVRQNELNAPDVSTLAASTAAQTYYVLAYPASLPSGAAASFTISARALDFSLDAVGPQQVGNAGTVTLALHGGQLRSDMTFEIVDAHGGVHSAESVFVSNSSLAYVTFDLMGLPLGTYSVRVRDGARTATLTNGINITTGTPGSVQAHLSMPRAMRPGWTGPVTVDYANVGNTDVVAPLMVLSVENAKLQLPGKTEFAYPTVQLLGINAEGPAGILPPGAHGTITLEMQPMASGGTITGKLWVLSDANQPWDWNAAKSLMRPSFVPVEAWDAIFANFTANVGSTVGQYQSVLANDATYLSQVGEYTPDVQQLLALELNQAGLNDLTQRYALGAFGRGVSGWWELTVREDSDGMAAVGVGSRLRFFRRQADGSYRSVGREKATLSAIAGGYQLREVNGSVFAFRSDGRLDYLEDRNGNRVTATYDGGTLTTLQFSDGDAIVLHYNSNGRIDQITDPVGRLTTYSYDPPGEHLLSVTDPQGTTTFSYAPALTPATTHLLQSVGFPGGTHLFASHDSRGRLVRIDDGEVEAVGYAYDAPASVVATHATGDRERLLLNDAGQMAGLTDGLARPTRLSYDAHYNLTRLVGPAGETFSFGHDDQDRPISVVDPSGASNRLAYEPLFDSVSALTDARGNLINYSYDAKGNRTAIVYPGGADERWEYDAGGRITSWTNSRGQRVRYTYDGHDLLIRQEVVGGLDRQFSYDAHRNLVAITDASGTAAMEYDDAERLTKITSPSGRYLRFTYDAGGRRIRSEDQDGFRVSYAYDATGRLETLTDAGNALLVRYSYDAAGRVVRKDLGNGGTVMYAYDGAGQVLSVVNRSKDSSVLSRFDYTYDATGLCTTMRTVDGQWTYTHDPSGQLTHAVFASTNPGIANQDLTYVYDAAGNRVQAVQNGMATPYAVNALNQYTSVGTSAYAYDADGNLIARGAGTTQWTYTYDAENQLVAVNGPDGSWTYEYDAFGSRVAATHDGQRTEYLVDPVGLGDVVGTYDAAGHLIARYVHGAGLVGRVDASGEISYYDFDALGNVAELAAPNGALLNRYAYLPFGERLAGQESVDNPFQYVGQHGVIHDGNGLEFMRSRYFDAATGRFTQRDKAGLAGGVNLYAYVRNNPVDGIDPSGLLEELLLVHILNPTSPEAIYRRELLNAIVSLTEKFNVLAEYVGYGLRRGYIRATGLYSTAELEAMVAATKAEVAAFEVEIAEASWGATLSRWGTRVGNAARTVGRGVLSAATRHPLVAAAVVGVTIGTGLRYIDGVDEAAQMTLVDLNDWLGGWLLWTPRAAELGTPIVSSHDPNDLIGPAGSGNAHWIAPDQTLPYTIRFENDKQATAPAQVVRITEQLDPDLDLTTFQLGNFSFDGVVVTVPAGRTFYSERLDLRATYGLYLDISANLDFDTGIITWEFASVDPVTGTTPRDPLTGFLPPNVTSPIGQGYVTYTIRPQSSSAIGTPISAEASIVFDTNEPIDTPQVQNPVGPIADCAGDCNNSGQVTIDELLTMVDIALGNLQLQACAAADQNADGTVTIDEILTAVNYALGGCPAASASVQAQYVERAPSRALRATPTPTATATPTPSATPTESGPLM